MSYILEALKKSEYRRQQGSVPDLNTLPANIGAGSARRPASTRWLWLPAAIGIAAMAAGAAWWWAHSRPAAPPSLAPVPAAAAPQPVVAPAVAPIAAPTVARTVTPAVAPAAVPAAAPKLTPAVTPGKLAVAPAVTPAEVVTRPPKAVAPVVAAPRAPAAPTPAPEGAAAKPLKKPPLPAPAVQEPQPAGTSPSPASVKGVRPAAPESETAPAPPSRILNFGELPASLRRGLPPLSVSGYSVAEETDQRMVVINDRMLREGDEAAPDVRVDHIGAEGVVLSHKGYRFRPSP